MKVAKEDRFVYNTLKQMSYVKENKPVMFKKENFIRVENGI